MLIPNDSSIIHLIQLSVAPVFLIAGVAGLLNVFTGRLTRIIDKLEKIDTYISAKEKKDKEYEQDEKLVERRKFLIMRMQNTNQAIFFCAATGLMVALLILSVFAGFLLSFQIEIFISLCFILAMFFLIISLILFLREIHFTTSFIKNKKENKTRI